MQEQKSYLYLITSIALLFLLTQPHQLLAANNINSPAENAKELRAAIETKKTTQVKSKSHTIYELPISRGFDQGETCLCWAYAFFSALETLHLVEYPDERFELSRGVMQYINIKNRIELKIEKLDDHLDLEKYKGCSIESGQILDNVYLLNNYGAVQFFDYHDVISPPNYESMLNNIFAATTTEEKLTIANNELSLYFRQQIPDKTLYHNKSLTIQEFGKNLLERGTWKAYGIRKNKNNYSFVNTNFEDKPRQTWATYISRDRMIDKIKTAIINKKPVIYAGKTHIVLIYGMILDEQDNLVTLYIKDSYPDFLYESDADKLLDRLNYVVVQE